MSPLTTADPPPAAAPPAADPRRHRDTARAGDPLAALAALHEQTHPGVLPAGPGGHVLVPWAVEAGCDRYETPAGPVGRPAAPAPRAPVCTPGLAALRIPGAGPADPAGGWAAGVAWIRSGLTDRLVARAAAHLRDRSVQGAPTLNLPMVRAMLADAALAATEGRTLLEAGEDAATLAAAHRAWDEAGRICLHLFGATGFLADGPGAEVRIGELLGDTYAPHLELP